MACSSSRVVVTRPVWTPGAVGTGHFLVFRRLRVEEWKRARVSVIVESSTSAEWTATAGARYANEEQLLAAASFVSFGTSRTDNGVTYATAFTDLVDDWQWVEIGAQAANLGSSVVERGLVTLVIDLQS